MRNWIQRSLSFKESFLLITFTFKEHVKSVKIYMVKFNVTILDNPKVLGGLYIKGK